MGRQALAALRRIGFNTQYRTFDVAENVGTFLVRNVHPRVDFELILTVKIETRHPVEGQFSSEFPAICNRLSYGGLKSQDLEILWGDPFVFHQDLTLASDN